ncbi:MAG: TonB-dependent receptor [Ferruginibacter sp.]
MKYLFFIMLQGCVLQYAVAQVSGKIVSAKDEPIAAANVLLLNSTDSSLIKATLSGQDGTYVLENIAAGKYLVRISSAGYQNMELGLVEITDPLQHKDLGTQMMTADTKYLQEVVMRSEKPMVQQTAEGLIVNAANSILTKGSNALQVLERSPGVVINRRDNSIELNGKSGVMVMLNGKPIRMAESELVEMLAGMSGDDIATIELLTSPSAKYDAEGTAGLINIVLKKNKDKGTNGSATVSAGYAYREKASGSFNISHNTAKVNLYGSYGFSHNATYGKMFVDSWQHMPFMGGGIHAFGWTTTHARFINHNATVGLDAKLNAKTTIGGSIIYTRNKASGAGDTDFSYNILPDSILQFEGRNAGMSRWNNMISTVYVERVLRATEKISLNVDHLFFSNDRPYQVEGTFVNKHGEEAGNGQALSAPEQRGFAKTNIRVFVGKVDYTNELSKKAKMEAGVKSNYTQSTSYSGFESLVNGEWISDPQAVNNIVMKEGIAAAYASFNTQINPSTTLVTGMRFEYAYTKMNDPKNGRKIVNRKLSSLFPSLFVTKKINGQSELQLSYTKRITRPSYNDLASYVGYSDPTAVQTGNPFLKPTITHNIRLGYQYKSYSASLVFSRDENPISRYQLTESAQRDMLFISPQNISWQNNIMLQTNLPFKIKNWWTMNYSFAGGLRQYKVTYTKEPFVNSYFGYSFNYSQTFKMPHEYSAELSGSYGNANYNGTQKVEGILRMNIGIKKELKNNKGSFQLAVNDLLMREKYDIQYGTLTQEAFSIKNHIIVYTETSRFPIVRLTYSRSFGTKKAASSRRASSGDEQDRIRRE